MLEGQWVREVLLSGPEKRGISKTVLGIVLAYVTCKLKFGADDLSLSIPYELLSSIVEDFFCFLFI